MWHIQELCKHIQAYSELCVTLSYLEPKYIQNQKHIQKRGMFKVLVYLEP